MKTKWLTCYFCSPILALLSVGNTSAATPRDELLKFVPDDVAFCMVVQDLRGHAAAFETSPLVARFRTSPLGQALIHSQEAQKLQQFAGQVQTLLGLDWPTLRDDVLGDAVVFAYRPGPPGKPEQEQGLFLVRARDAKVLTELIDRVNKMQQTGGQVEKLEEKEHEGVTYVKRVEKKGSSYYYLSGPVVIFSAQEEMLRQALARGRAAGEGVPAIAKRFNDLGAGKALVSIWVNPRPLDGELAAKIERAAGPESVFLKQFAVYWKALSDAALTLHVDGDLSVSVSLRARPDELPAAARRFLAGLTEPSAVWRRVPQNALVAVAGRFDLPALVETVAEFLPDVQRQTARGELDRTLGAALGKDSLREVLSSVGPDWGWYLLQAEPGKGWIPQGVFALRVDGKGLDPLDQALLSALNSAATLGVLGHNKQHPERPVVLKTLMVGKDRVKSIVSDRGGLPQGLQPTFGLSGGYLVLASSPPLFEAFAAGEQKDPTSTDTPLLRVSFKVWRTYLLDTRDLLPQVIAERNHLSLAEAKQRFEGLLASLQWLDRLDIGLRTENGLASVTLRLRTEPELKARDRK